MSAMSAPRFLVDQGVEVAHERASQLRVRVRLSDEAARVAAVYERRADSYDGHIPPRTRNGAMMER
jgi:hypothetical protein